MSLEGVWHNELGSEMSLTVEPGGVLSGYYETKVGDAPGSFPLSGRYNCVHPADNGRRGETLGWTVSWMIPGGGGNHPSATSWTGQYFEDPYERLITTWLLVAETAPDWVWASTQVAQDFFTRTAPEPHRVQERLLLGTASSHPLGPHPASLHAP